MCLAPRGPTPHELKSRRVMVFLGACSRASQSTRTPSSPSRLLASNSPLRLHSPSFITCASFLAPTTVMPFAPRYRCCSVEFARIPGQRRSRPWSRRAQLVRSSTCRHVLRWSILARSTPTELPSGLRFSHNWVTKSSVCSASSTGRSPSAVKRFPAMYHTLTAGCTRVVPSPSSRSTRLPAIISATACPRSLPAMLLPSSTEFTARRVTLSRASDSISDSIPEGPITCLHRSRRPSPHSAPR
mmetsp:Transcript_47862/g.113000  ORF Transcript_47862/g.113000 Transcript_47862/m.113000 type:complete len:243 (-) Transcript_47862:3289-4017(-)